MRLIIGANTYDITDAIGGASLGDLMKLKVKTKTETFPGITVKSINNAFKEISRKLQAQADVDRVRYAEYVAAGGDQPEDEVDLSRPDDFDTLDLLGDEQFLQNMIGLVYLARRKAGESVELEDAEATSFASMQFDFDDEQVEADPKDPAGAEDENEPAPTL